MLEDSHESLRREQNCTTTVFRHLPVCPVCLVTWFALSGQATQESLSTLLIIPLFRSLWSQVIFCLWIDTVLHKRWWVSFGTCWVVSVVLIYHLLLSPYLITILMKLRQRTTWGLQVGSIFFLFQTICQCSKGLSFGWFKQNKNTSKRSHSEKYLLISDKNSFHLVFTNCTS